MKLLIQLIANPLALMAATYLLPGVSFMGSWWQLLIAGLILGLLNSCIKPMLKFFLPPFILITLGFFTITINISLLALLALIIPNLSISGIWPAFWGIIIISLTNYSINTIMDYKD
ncbi:MAG: phage holin family protein [Patescibacteria group bacterium]|nr:phage holin family protein [Patescibacteria group bacterium]